MNSIDPNALLRLTRTFTDLGDAAAAALLAVMAHPTTQHKEIAKKCGLTTKAITRATKKARDAGLFHGKAGAWTVTLPPLAGQPVDALPDAGVKLAAELRRLETESRSWKGRTYRSRLERDVAFVLTTANVPFESEVPYKTLFATDRAWTCDFVVVLAVDSGLLKVGIECTARADARATMAEKVAACTAANFVLIVIDSVDDLVGLRGRLRDEREKAKARALAASAPAPIDPTKPYVTASGRYVDPRAVRPRGYVPTPLFTPSPPPPVVVLTPEQIADRALVRAEEALEDAEYAEMSAAAQAARETKRAEIETRKAAWNEEERGRALAAALRAREERDRPARARPEPEPEPDEDDDDVDPEALAIARAEGCDDTVDIERGEV